MAEGAAVLPPCDSEGESMGRVVGMPELIGWEISTGLVEVEVAALAGIELACDGSVTAITFGRLLLI